MTIDLGAGVTFSADRASGCCVTEYPGGFKCGASRVENDENLREAAEQGYSGGDIVWRSLLEHELGHTVVARQFFVGSESLVLRHESGAKPARYALRLYEETLVLALQSWMNTHDRDPIFSHHCDEFLQVLANEIRRYVAALCES